jgi:hypothetical protein
MRQLVESRHKILRSAHHPDKGGRAQDFHEVETAYAQALAEIQRRESDGRRP